MLKSGLTGLAACLMLGASMAAADVIPALHDALPQAYKDSGIKVAVFNDWAPDEYVDADGTLKGWSVDLAHEMDHFIEENFAMFDGALERLLRSDRHVSGSRLARPKNSSTRHGRAESGWIPDGTAHPPPGTRDAAAP